MMKLIFTSLFALSVFHIIACKDSASGGSKDDRFSKLSVVNRLYNANATDHLFSVDPLEQQIAQDAGYVQDAVLGRIPLRYSDLPDCNLLLPIYKLSQPVSTNHLLMLSMNLVDEWFVNLASNKQSNWKYAGVIGYGVQNKNECGATRQVRHFSNENPDENSQLSLQILTTDDNEANGFPSKGIKRSKVPAFYIWE